MKPFFVRAAGTTVEVWSGYRIQFSGMERHDWQKALKAELKEALSRLAMPVGAPFAGYYDSTDPHIADTRTACSPTCSSQCRVESHCCASSEVPLLPPRRRFPLT
jgi:hypothetical protein